ncbi:MAG: hypothetical protein EXX96DRAFT_466139, partial [Benjaminiella poitrasii]
AENYRQRLDVSQKIEICDMHVMDSSMTQLELGVWAQQKFNLPKLLSQKTIANI